MSQLDNYCLLGRWTFRCRESGSSLSRAEPSSPPWNTAGSQAPQMGWGPGSCREGWVSAYRARWEQMASRGDQWVPAGIAECLYCPQKTPETLRGHSKAVTAVLVLRRWRLLSCWLFGLKKWLRFPTVFTSFHQRLGSMSLGKILKANSVPRQKSV